MRADNFRNIKEYDAYIVDMDGTLYYKGLMHVRMAIALLEHYLVHLSDCKELLLLQKYRKLRDDKEYAETDDFESVIRDKLSELYGYTRVRTDWVVDNWILERPLEVLFFCRDKQLIRFLKDRQNQGKEIYIYSDYPALEKCKRVQLVANDVYWPDKRRVSVLKPSPQGIETILGDHGLDKTRVLFIGDRLEKDGICAQNAGIDYIILKRNSFARKIQYHLLEG